MMMICAHEMTKHVCKISHLNSKGLLRKLQKMLGGYFILPHPVVKLKRKCDICSAKKYCQKSNELQISNTSIPVAVSRYI